MTTSDLGGTATPTATEAYFTNVNAGSGWLDIKYNFASAPNEITVDDGSARFTATRS